ncbi:hypothetical protein GWK47_039133 [Chionoecetes opilio]|uniref:Uncharacterized protein n=1 Tax=Chionoecetes opilio TaxID=41210 RepID=A0A8J4YK34_CHIOP|nr:hypothetical protein GWK47_039133 [Chionoecetes opilio]
MAVLNDIKGGYSTANQDWPYFQILDQIVPLMRKEKIEKLPPSSDPKDLEGHDSLDPLTSPPCDPCDPDPMPGVQGVTADVGKCKTEVGDTGEPPRKRGRGRRAALRARDRWWGAVEDSDLGSDSVGSGAARGDLPPHPPTKADPLEASQMELQTFNMLETCSSALTEIRDVLRTHTQRQENFMQCNNPLVQTPGLADAINGL